MNKSSFSRLRRIARIVWYGANLYTGSVAYARSESEVIAPVSTTSDAWNSSVGFSATSRPRYPGNDEIRSSMELLALVEQGRCFIGGAPDAGTPVGLGAHPIRDSSSTVGAEFTKARGDIDRPVSVTVFAAFRCAWWAGQGDLALDPAGMHESTRAKINVETHVGPIDQQTVSAGPAMAWAGARYLQKFFVIDAAEDRFFHQGSV